MATIMHREWKIVILPHGPGWRAMIYRPSSALGESEILTTPDLDGEKALIESAKGKIDSLIRGVARPL